MSMSDVEDVVEAAKPAETPYEFLARMFTNAPTEITVESYKQQVPGGRVRLFQLPDGKRVVLLRGIAALELAAIQEAVSKLKPAEQLFELQVACTTKCTLWASFTKSGKLTETDLKASGAGLAVTLHAVIWDLSDYIDPAVIDTLSVDL